MLFSLKTYFEFFIINRLYAFLNKFWFLCHLLWIWKYNKIYKLNCFWMICDRIKNAIFLSHFDKWFRNLWIEHLYNSIQSLSFEFFTSRFQHFLIYHSSISIIAWRFKNSLRLFRDASFKNKYQFCLLLISIHKIILLMHISSYSKMNKNLTDFCFFFSIFIIFISA